jgi:hypothetical protein
MKKTFGAVVAGAVAGLIVGNVAVAKDTKKKEEKKAAAPAGEGWCKSNECAGKVTGAKNECKGHMACQGMTKEACTKEGHGTWETGPKPS